MASDIGTAKAKDTPKDTTQLDNRESSSSAVKDDFTSTQEGNLMPSQDNSSSTSGRLDPSSSPQQRNNSSTLTRNAYTTSNRDSTSSISVQRTSLPETGDNISQSAANSVNVPVNPDDRPLRAKLNSKVAHRAYEIYEQNGARQGEDLFHWLQAESEMLTRIPEIQQSDSFFSAVVPLHGFSAEDISVAVEPNRALILADKQNSSGESGSDNSDGGPFSSRRSAFFVTDWPEQIDPATATAQIKQGNLVLTVRRSGANSQESKTL